MGLFGFGKKKNQPSTAPKQEPAPDFQQPSGNGTLKLVNGSWTYVKTCPNSYSCNEKNTDCGECVNGTVKCENTDLTGYKKTCSKGKWSTEKCSNGYSCKSDGKTCGACVDGPISCTNGTDGVGSFQECVKGVKQAAKNCDDEASCNSEGACNECKVGKQKCVNNNEILVCASAPTPKWVHATYCSCSSTPVKCN